MDGSIEEWAAHLIPMGSVLFRTDEPFLSEVPCSQATFFTAAWVGVRMPSPPTVIIVISKRFILVDCNSVSGSLGASGIGFARPSFGIRELTNQAKCQGDAKAIRKPMSKHGRLAKRLAGRLPGNTTKPQEYTPAHSRF